MFLYTAINLTEDSDSLRVLVNRMDQCLTEYQLPSFYKVSFLNKLIINFKYYPVY